MARSQCRPRVPPGRGAALRSGAVSPGDRLDARAICPDAVALSRIGGSRRPKRKVTPMSTPVVQHLRRRMSILPQRDRWKSRFEIRELWAYTRAVIEAAQLMFEVYPKYSAAAAGGALRNASHQSSGRLAGHNDAPATDHERPSPTALGVCDGLRHDAGLAPEQSAGKSDGSSLDGFVYSRLSRCSAPKLKRLLIRQPVANVLAMF